MPFCPGLEQRLSIVEGMVGSHLGLILFSLKALGSHPQDPAWKSKTTEDRAFWESGGQRTLGEPLLFSEPQFPSL